MDQKRLFDKFLIPLIIAGMFFLGTSLLSNKAEPEGRLRVSFLSVGQGDSALITSPHNKYILVDGGPDKSVLAELGKLMPPTEKNLDAVILSHPHADHVSGLNYVLERYKVRKVYLTGVSYNSPEYLEFQKKIMDLNIPAEKLYEGRNIYIDEIAIEPMWPREDLSGKQAKEQNDTSIVFNLVYKENTFVFTGDLSMEKQEEMLAGGKAKKAEVLKVPHHGSKTGIARQFLDILNADYAVISVGADNSFGHPASAAIQALSKSKILRTDLSGTINIYSDGKAITF